MIVVIDTNVLLQLIGKRSIHRSIWQAYLDGKIKFAVLHPVLLEYEETLINKTSPLAAQLTLAIILESTSTIIPGIFYFFNLIAVHPDDNKLIDVAFAANTEYIVTTDRHFNILKDIEFPKIKGVTPDEFLQIV